MRRDGHDKKDGDTAGCPRPFLAVRGVSRDNAGRLRDRGPSPADGRLGAETGRRRVAVFPFWWQTMQTREPGPELSGRKGSWILKTKAGEPRTPPARNETIRQGIMCFLEGRTASAKEVSAEARIPEKEVYEHLEHIQRTSHKAAHHLVVIPAECRKCGFVFKKRQRLRKPGRCPVCRGESIQDPLFSLA